jgi:hypothetical protein
MSKENAGPVVAALAASRRAAGMVAVRRVFLPRQKASSAIFFDAKAPDFVGVAN